MATICRGCGKPLTGDDRVADGCPCNNPRGINHGIVPVYVCTCTSCDPEQTGSVRFPSDSERLWKAIEFYASAPSDDDAWAKAEVEREVKLIRTIAAAKAIGEMEAGVNGEGGVWPGWVYEARQAIRHQNENLPWLPDLLKILGWQGGTIYDALQAVSRLVHAVDAQEKKRV